jgi:hypothetical protein
MTAEHIGERQEWDEYLRPTVDPLRTELFHMDRRVRNCTLLGPIAAPSWHITQALTLV